MDVRRRTRKRLTKRKDRDASHLQARKAGYPSVKSIMIVGVILLGAYGAGLACNKGFAITKVPSETISLKWWQTTIVYQIYPRSFQDSDGDGIGDIKGITQRLDYIQSLNVRAIWLSPIFRSPMRDMGYDISNHTDIDPIFGDIDDFKQLLSTAHHKGIKVILDFVPNHTSDLHPWFKLSRKGVAPYKDFYVWHKGDAPPNNWLSLFRGSAWTRDGVRGEYYYHAFLPQQPDLNWRCPQLVHEMKNVLRFWLEMGVDGFRVDAIQNMFETQDLTRNESEIGDHNLEKDSWFSLHHEWTFDQPEIGGAVRGWREVLDEYEERDGKTRFLVVETLYDKDVSIRNQYYKFGADMPFNFDLLRLNQSCGGRCVHRYVTRELEHLKSGQWPNFVVGNHDNPRIGSKMGKGFIDVVNMLLLTLPGTPTTYYGEEIGMVDVPVTFELGHDLQAQRQGKNYFLKYSRDPSRTPMRWHEGTNAGFTSGSVTWLPTGSFTSQESVKGQMQQEKSHLQLYRKLAVFRDELSYTDCELRYAKVNDNIFSYLRSSHTAMEYLITLNFGSESSVDDYTMVTNTSRGEVTLTTGLLYGSDYGTGNIIDLSEVKVQPGYGMIIQLL